MRFFCILLMHKVESSPMHTTQLDLRGMSRDSLLACCAAAGVKPVHAEHLTAAIFRRGHSDIATIPEIPHRLRDHLLAHTFIQSPTIAADQQSTDGTRKLLLKMGDGKAVETVLIPAEGRLTQCVSTQVGCAMGCRFCLTATAGLNRHLTAGEMVAEVMAGQQISDHRVRNLVLMGMGEPLHNYAAVAEFVRIASDPKGMAFSPNRITLSTSGIVPKIYAMAEDQLPCNLAVSLNATSDAVRDQIMPINRKYPLAELMRAVRDYIAARGNKRVLIEYVLLAGVNDSLDDAKRLAALMDGVGCTVNLLPFNPYPGSRFARPDEADVEAFHTILADQRIVVVVRRSRGRDISAACGQLIE